MSNSNFIVEVKDVVKDYSGHRALDHVNVHVPRGGIFGLLGPNGAGKTTLIRILNRITAPDSGKVFFDGRPFVVQDLDSIGYLPEERGLYRKMKVGDQAIYLAQLKGLSHAEAKKRLTTWFEKMDIMPWWNKKVQELSKGMAQKVQFICTVIHEPQLLIFDEPFSGFDPINVEILKDEILNLRDKGHTIIFSTHNMQSVEELCDNITLINKSRVVLEGDIQVIKRGYKGDAYKLIYDEEVALQEQDYEHFHIREHHVDKYGRTTILLDNHQGLTSKDILQAWSQRGNIQLFEEIIPSMHEIFLKVVQESAPAGTEKIEENE